MIVRVLFVFIILYVSLAILPPLLGDLLGSACLIQMDRRHTGVQLDSVGLRASTVRIPVCMHGCEQAGRRPPLQRKFGFFLAKTLELRRGFGLCASVWAFRPRPIAYYADNYADFWRRAK